MFTYARVRKNDYQRIVEYVKKFNDSKHTGRTANHDVIAMALDALDEKINQTNVKSIETN